MPARRVLAEDYVSRSARPSTAAQYAPHAGEHVVLPILGDHPDDDPARTLQVAQSALVADVLTTVNAVLVAVVLGRNPEFLPSHVEDADQRPIGADRDLRARRGRPASTSSSRNQLSLSEAARPSTSGSNSRS